MDLERFGRHIKLARKAKGYSVEQLAEKLDISAKHIWQIERGRRACSVQLLVAFCNELTISSEYILSGNIDSHVSEDVSREEFYDTYLSLSDRDQAVVAAMAKTLKETKQ
ncbi:MAG: helix-turn-helix domain-containing protein [Lachnospiraceae bacterium]|nr:helix-turn-helix domain-containing protein [Lachnospiraceae bacterium]